MGCNNDAERHDLSPEVLPRFRDLMGDENRPHPDGHPWRKACVECALRSSNPQGYDQGDLDRIRQGEPRAIFYCIHREDGGRHRPCACYSALRRGTMKPAITKRRKPKAETAA